MRPPAAPVPVTRVRLWAARLSLAIVGLMLVVIVVGQLLPWYLDRPEAVPRSTPTAVSDLGAGPFVSPEPVVRPQPYRSTAPQALVGPVFTAQDGVREMALRGVPFTFRAPRAWGCLAATVDVQATAWRCIDEQAGQGGPRVDIVVRQCPGQCTEDHRAEVDRELSQPPAYVARDPATRVAESTAGGRYALAVNRVFAPTPGGPPEWLVVAEAQAPADARGSVQKIVNDIYGQTV